ncbi:MAG: type IV pilus biogenesis/stability protein PilW [Pseudomonadota bacterium]
MNLKSMAMIAVSMAWLAGCVTTTTGPKVPQANRTDAAESNYNLGRQYYLRGNYERARDALNRSLEFNERLAKTHMMLGLTYERLDVPRLAKQHYELAVRSEPRNLAVRNGYAVYLCNTDQADEAREQFERVVSAPDNDDPEVALTNAGVCMQSASNVDAAEDYFRRALDEKPNHPEALLQLMLLKHGGGDSLSARAFLERYMSVAPPSPAILELAIEIERKTGNDSAECEYMRRLLSEFPTSEESKRVLRFSADRCMR